MSDYLQKPAIVVSAPSGTGKTTLNRRLTAEFPDEVEISVSYTTRKPRPGEENGVHYHFVNETVFRNAIESDEFIEWAMVHGHLYGTSKRELERIIRNGHRPLLEIDVQGWLKARSSLKNAVSIFILPPTLHALWLRLEERGSDTIEDRMIRLHNAYHEIAIADHYQHFIVNDVLDHAYAQLKAIAIAGKTGEMDARSGRLLCEKLKHEYHNAEWIQEVRKKINA